MSKRWEGRIDGGRQTDRREERQRKTMEGRKGDRKGYRRGEKSVKDLRLKEKLQDVKWTGDAT